MQSRHARRRSFAAFGRSPDGAQTSGRRGSAGARCSSLCLASQPGAPASAARLARSRARRGERGKRTITESSTHTPNFDARFSARGKLYRYSVHDSFFELKLQQLRLKKTESDDSTRFGDLRVWEEPVEGARYVLGMDTAYGRSEHADKNCISVWRCFADKLVQVAEYATPEHDVKQATWVLAHLAGVYSDCLINHEVNGPGGMVITELEHLRALMNADMNARIVKDKDWENALTNARWYLYHRPDSMGSGYAIGFMTNFNNKYMLMFGYRSAYVSHELKIRSMNLLREMTYVVQDGNEIGAPNSSSQNSKDDRVFAAALAHKAWQDWIKRDMLGKGLTYDRVMSEQRGETTRMAKSINNQVARFFMTMEEKRQLLPPPQTWRESRGL